jgi:hypothetical protein
MNTFQKLAAAVIPVLLLAGCASSEYIISKSDGTMITTYGKPKLDEQTGMYTYKGTDGKEMTIKKEDVKQIMER